MPWSNVKYFLRCFTFQSLLHFTFPSRSVYLDLLFLSHLYFFYVTWCLSSSSIISEHIYLFSVFVLPVSVFQNFQVLPRFLLLELEFSVSYFCCTTSVFVCTWVRKLPRFYGLGIFRFLVYRQTVADRDTYMSSNSTLVSVLWWWKYCQPHINIFYPCQHSALLKNLFVL